MLRGAWILLAGIAALSAVALAFAHAEPANIKPGDGAVLDVAPPQVQIEMTQDMARQAGANDIVVVDANGKQITTAPAVIDNVDRKKLTVALPLTLAFGTYTVQWRTLSADDGDPATGTTSFTYDPRQTPKAGKEVLQVSLLGSPEAGAGSATTSFRTSGGGGTSWILLVAVGIGALVVGAGGTYLFIQNKR